MNIVQFLLILFPWTLWLAYWVLSAGGTKATARMEESRSRTYQALPLIAGGMLISCPAPSLAAFNPDWSVVHSLQWVGFAVAVVGLLFSAWGRIHLGTNWSVSVTLKENHELVRTGPYRVVRHPIYTGCLLALAGDVLIGGEWRGVVGLLLIFASLFYKVRKEEHWLTEYFGGSYQRYSKEVAALIPGVL